MERFLHRSALLALAVLVGFAPIAAHTQALAPDNPTDPFWKLLAMVPNDDLSRGYLSYANYQAITEIFDVSGLSYEDVVASVESGEGWAVATLTEQGERWESAMSLTRHSALGLVAQGHVGRYARRTRLYLARYTPGHSIRRSTEPGLPPYRRFRSGRHSRGVREPGLRSP